MIIEKVETTQLSPDPHGLNRFDFSVRVPEKSEIFNEAEAQKYILGCDIPETADDLLLALEMQRMFEPLAIRSMGILDAMCGPGRLGREFLDLGAQHVVFHDGDKTMITHAMAEASKIRQSGQIIESVKSDVCNIKLDDNRFDLVICHNATHQLSDQDRLEEAMREFVRITVPGGHVVVADFQRPATLELKKAASARLNVTNPEVVDLLIPTYAASFSKEEFEGVFRVIPGIRKWSVVDAEPPMLTWEMWQRVNLDPFRGHLMDYSPASLRAIIQKE